MTDIQLIRDLDTLKKMYRYLFNAVTDAVNICNEYDVKDILISAQQRTEEIYIGKNCSDMYNDDETIIDLLKLLVETECEKTLSQQNQDFIDECKDWICDLQEGRTKALILDLVKKEGLSKE